MATNATTTTTENAPFVPHGLPDAGLPPAPRRAPTRQPVAPVPLAADPSQSSKPTTYKELFLDAHNDPYAGEYAGIMQPFATTMQALPRNAVRNLVDRVFDKAEAELQAYLVLTHEDDRNYIQLLHRPSVLRSPLSSNEPDERFAFLGDVRGVQPPMLVGWPDGAFNQTNAVNVLSDGAIDTELANAPEVSILGPFENGTAGVTAIRTRKLMYLPAKFVPIALGRILTPRQAWDDVGGAIRAEPVEVQTTLEPIMNWLKASLTLWDHTDYPANHVDLLRPPAIFTPEHQDHVSALVNSDLPTTPPTPPMGGLAPLVGAVNQLTSEVIQTRLVEAERRANASAKTVQQHYGHAVEVLLRLCQAASPSELPPMYLIIANSSKRNLRVNLEQHACQVARNLGLEQYAPTITPDLAAKLSSATFLHYDVNNLEEGIQPFITPAWTAQQREELTAMVAAYDTLQEGATVHLQDLLTLRSVSKVAPPATMLQAQHTGYSFRILLEMMLGQTHDHTLQFANFMHYFVRTLPELEAMHQHRSHLPTLIMRYLQIRFSQWTNYQVNSPSRVPSPNYLDLLERIKHQERGWEPFIPQRYLPSGGPGPTPAQPSQPAARTQVQMPAIAPTPPPTTPSPTALPSTTQRQRINNTNYQPVYQQFRDKNLPLSQVRAHARQANDPIPLNSKGIETCLSYHVFGFCWSNCTRITDHTTQAAGDQAKTVAWCTAHFV